MIDRVQTLRSSVKGQRPANGTRQIGEFYVNFADYQFGTINTSSVALDLIAVRYFSAAADYSIGEFVVQAGVLYRASTAVVAGPFTPSQWTRIVTTVDLALKEDVIVAGTTAQYWRGDKTWAVLNKTAVGLGNVDNTADVSKPVSTATQAALDLKVNRAGDTMGGHLGLPTGPSISQAVRRDFVDAEVSALNATIALKAPIANPVLTGNPQGPTPLVGNNSTSLATTAFVTRAVTNGTLGFVPEAPIDGIQYVRQSATWQPVIVPEENYIGDTPPAGPKPGQIWFESDTGDLFIYYDDGSSYQWIQVNAGAAATADSSADPGDIKWVSTPAPPYGWMKANGAAISRSAYSKLYNAIGLAFGPGDGSTTFNLPDLRSEFIRGWDDSRGVDVGRIFGSSQAPNLAAHAHDATGGDHTHTASSGNVSADHAHGVNINTGYVSANHTHQAGLQGPTKIQSGNWGSYGANTGATSGFDANHYHNVAGGTGGINANHTHAITINSADVTPTIGLTGTGTDTRPRNVALLGVIKY